MKEGMEGGGGGKGNWKRGNLSDSENNKNKFMI